MAKVKKDNLSREELENGRTAAPGRRGAARRAPALLLTLALVLGLVTLAAYRDRNGLDSVRRLLSYDKASADADGRQRLYDFDSDRTNEYALLGERLLIASATRIALQARGGEEIFSQTVKLANPALVSCGARAVVYDAGGGEAYLLSDRGLMRDLSGETGGGMVSASLNSSGYLALTTRKSGYKSAVTVYNASGEPVFTFNSSDHYVIDACVLNDCRHVAVASLGEADGAFASRLAFYALDSERPEAESTLNGSLVLTLGNLGGTLCALEDDRVTTFHADGSLAGTYRYEYPYLRACSLGGGDFAVVLTSRYRSGSALRLASMSADGELLGTLDVRREILDVSAAGKYVAVLYGDSVSVYTSDLAEHAALSGTDYARRVIMREDGSALLIGSTDAWLFVP